MRQHILRIVIVLALVAGIGFIVYLSVNNSAPFVIADYIEKENARNSETVQEMNAISSDANSEFREYLQIDSILEDNIEMYATYLNNTEISKESVKELKNLYSTYEENLEILESSLISLKNYVSLETSEQNETELNRRREKVDIEMESVVETKLQISYLLEGLVNEKVYNGNNYNPIVNISSCLNVMSQAYMETKLGYSFVVSVNNKYDELLLNSSKVGNELIDFSRIYNGIEKDSLLTEMKTYFTNGTAAANVSTLISFLNSEVYYE